MLVGSKMDPLLAKAKPVSNGGSTSAVTYLGREKNCFTTAAKRICERNNCRHQEVKKEDAPGTREEIPLQLMVTTMVRQFVSLYLLEVVHALE